MNLREKSFIGSKKFKTRKRKFANRRKMRLPKEELLDLMKEMRGIYLKKSTTRICYFNLIILCMLLDRITVKGICSSKEQNQLRFYLNVLLISYGLFLWVYQ